MEGPAACTQWTTVVSCRQLPGLTLEPKHDGQRPSTAEICHASGNSCKPTQALHHLKQQVLEILLAGLHPDAPTCGTGPHACSQGHMGRSCKLPQVSGKCVASLQAAGSGTTVQKTETGLGSCQT